MTTSPQPTPAEFEAADSILNAAHGEEEITRDDIARIIAAHRAPADPVQAHATELETLLLHIWLMADEELRTREVNGHSAIWQIEADARTLLSSPHAELKAVTK